MRYIVSPPVAPAVAVVGSDSRFPVHRIYCVGRNYAPHVREMGGKGEEPPVFFLKPADAALLVEVGATGELPYPSLTHSLHHEVELVVAVGVGGRDIAPDQGLQHVLGYAVGLDMTRRDLQQQMKDRRAPWELGKSFEHAAPIGPITPAGAVGDMIRAEISLSVNGERRQHGALGEMIWSVPQIIAQLSRAWTLAPGDLIYTGTPAGVAAVERGDLIEARITGLEPLRVRVV